MNPIERQCLSHERRSLDKQSMPLLVSKFFNLYANLGESVLVKINGKSEEIQSGTVLELLKTKNIEPQMVAVEINNKMLERGDFSTTHLNDGDHVEFLFYMGGGR